MKKVVVLLICVLLLTGCSIKRLDNNNISINIKKLLSLKVNLHNVYFEGYKYYVPHGLKFNLKEEYNALLSDKYNNKYYLFIDAIAFYYKYEYITTQDNNVHYFENLDYNNKKGYIKIEVVENNKNMKYVTMVYNYAKIESLVEEKNLNYAVSNMCYILRSIKFNRKILKSLIGNDKLNYKEEDYKLFKEDSSKQNFLDVVSKYEDESYKDTLEDEKINIEEDK